jgi:hypothetical protein
MPETAAAMRAPGGFCWWYIDAIDAAGNGFVLIWSFGLPFLPGHTSAARAGRAPASADAPALNVVVYRDGRPDFYLLQRYSPEEAHWDGNGVWSFGRTRIASRELGDGSREVVAAIDADVPGCAEPLVGEVRLFGRARLEAKEPATTTEEEVGHWWSPICTGARADLQLHCGDSAWSWNGPAYHDRNASLHPIDRLGIRRWMWARFCDGETTWVLYEVEPLVATATRIVHWIAMRGDGTVDVQTAVVGSRKRARGLFGAPHFAVTRFEAAGNTLEIRDKRLLDDGFFYVRKAVELIVDGRSIAGVAEEVLPGRVDRFWHRPLVRMAVHEAGRSSMWLPLFSGARQGRLRRLLRLPARRRLEAQT